MPPSDQRLLTIGEFSRLSRISIRMLRYYDDHGVLHPARTDRCSGYRHYSPDQLDTAHRLRRLRDIGLSVGELALCAPLLRDATAMRAVLERQRRRLLADAAAVADRLSEVDRLITRLEEPTMPVDIAHRTMPARTVASVREVIGTYADEGRLWERLMAALPAAGARPAEAALAVAVFHNEGYVESDADVEVQLDVTEPFPDRGELRCVDVAEQEIAVGTLRGGFEGIGDVMAALGTWTSAEGYRLAGPLFNIYVVGPRDEPDPSRWVIEVCAPVAREPVTR